MRCSLIDYGIFLIAAFLIWFFFNQQSELTYAEETVRIQNEAILRQNEYLQAQKRYIQALELESSPPLRQRGFQDLYKNRGI